MTVSLLLEMAVSGHPDRIALVEGERTITYAQLAAQASAGADLLAETGRRSVAYLGVGGADFVIGLFAAAAAGLPFAPINYRLSNQQVCALIARLDDPVILADHDYLDVARQVGTDVVEVTALRDGVDAGHSQVAQQTASPTAVVLYTSGTTSAPKAVSLSHENLTSYVMQTVEFGHAADDEGALICVPPYHVAGIGTILTNVYAGRRMVYLAAFDPAGWLDIAEREQVTSAMVVPTMLDSIVKELGDRQASVPSLRSLAYGGARMPRPILESALSAFPDVGFVNAYGLTETSSTIAVLGPDDHRRALESDDPEIAARLSSVGQPVPGIEIKVTHEDGSIVPDGEVGELWVRGPQVSGHYLGIGSVLDPDGWFPTKDRASVDLHGYLYVHGRSDDTIIRGGENIAPAEIEDVLVEHPDVRTAIVIGVPDDRWGEQIVAVVVPQTGAIPDAESLKRFVRSRLRGSRTPQHVFVRAGLPATATGKFQRGLILADVTQNELITQESEC